MLKIIEDTDDGKTFAILTERFEEDFFIHRAIWRQMPFCKCPFAIEFLPDTYRLVAHWDDDYISIYFDTFDQLLDEIFGAETSPEKVLFELTYA
jgi:hypothetical protein